MVMEAQTSALTASSCHRTLRDWKFVSDSANVNRTQPTSNTQRTENLMLFASLSVCVAGIVRFPLLAELNLSDATCE